MSAKGPLAGRLAERQGHEEAGKWPMTAASTEVPLADGLAWAALHQDAIVVQLPDRAGPLCQRDPAKR